MAATPLVLGMRRSIRTTSGGVARHRSSASWPSLASPTSSRSGASSTMVRRPERKIGWSSATTTRIAVLDRGVAIQRCRHGRLVTGQDGAHRRPGGVAAGDRAGAAELGGPLAHGGEPDPGPELLGQADAVVLDDDVQGAVQLQGDPAPLTAAVTQRVRHRLQGDPVRRHLDRRRQVAVHDAVHLDAAHRLRLLLDRTDEAQVVDRGRAQAVDQPAYIGDGVLHLTSQVVQLGLGRGRIRSPDAPRVRCRPRTTPASVGPSPSCRSRRSRRRSSSVAATSRSWERARSRVSETARAADATCRDRSASSRRSADGQDPVRPGVRRPAGRSAHRRTSVAARPARRPAPRPPSPIRPPTATPAAATRVPWTSICTAASRSESRTTTATASSTCSVSAASVSRCPSRSMARPGSSRSPNTQAVDPVVATSPAAEGRRAARRRHRPARPRRWPPCPTTAATIT